MCLLYLFMVTSAPFLLPFVVLPPHQVRHVEVPQTKRTRELPQLVETEGLGENVGNLPIRLNINEFDITKEDTLVEKMVVHLNVLIPGVEDGVFHKLDIVEVVIVDRRRIGCIHLQILE